MNLRELGSYATLHKFSTRTLHIYKYGYNFGNEFRDDLIMCK
jgi:hypothetical protein